MLIFNSSSMYAVLAKARRFAKSSGTVLITGESGTGKELLAQYLHEHSPRFGRPCVRVNCAAFHEGLAESELFGHEQARSPVLPAGTMDSSTLQVMELCFWMKSENSLSRLRRSSSECWKKVNISAWEVRKSARVSARIIAATNRDLLKEVAEKRFRDDLYHRLDVLTLRISPLRERPEDIPALVQHFINQFGSENESPVTEVSDEVMEQLMSFHWPGNVRQLRNAIHRACVEAESTAIRQVSLGRTVATASDGTLPAQFLTLPLDEIERMIILSRLRRFDGNKTEAAAELGVTPRTLRNKIARWHDLKKAG